MTTKNNDEGTERGMQLVLPEEMRRDADGQTLLAAADVTVDPYRESVAKNGVPVHLTGKEYSLLLFLMRHRGRAWTLRELYGQIWKEDYLLSASNTVMVHILRLRKKLEDNPAEPKIIRTIYGKGYQIDS